MTPRWMLTTFFRDELNNLIPVASAYGHTYRVPMNPPTDDGYALIEMWSGAHQIEAAKQDPRLIVCPYLFDPSPLPDAVIQAYASFGAIAGMSMGVLVAMLADIEPIYGYTFS